MAASKTYSWAGHYKQTVQVLDHTTHLLWPQRSTLIHSQTLKHILGITSNGLVFVAGPQHWL